jgi:hypothetical protein
MPRLQRRPLPCPQRLLQLRMVAAMDCSVAVVAATGLAVVVASWLVVVGEFLVAAIRADGVLREPTELVAGEVLLDVPMGCFLEVQGAAEAGGAVAGSSMGIQSSMQCMGCKARKCMECRCMGNFRCQGELEQ